MVRKKGRRIGNKARRQVLAEAIEPRLLLSTYTVNTLSDSASPGAGLLTLRQAVADANANPGADTINFDPTVFTAGNSNTITLTQGEILFNDSSGATTLSGPTSGSLEVNVSGGGASRVFRVAFDSTVSISWVGVIDGSAPPTASYSNAYGGGIYNDGTLTVTDCIVHGNSATSPGDGGNAFGGGIYSTGSLTLMDDDISSNTAQASAEVETSNTFRNGGEAKGGGVYASGSLTISDCNMTNDTASGTASGFGPFEAGSALGGGVYAGKTATISDSVFMDNTAESAGTVLDALTAGGGIFVTSDSTITGDTIDSNSVVGGAPGENSATIGAMGGGITVGGVLTMSFSTVDGNTVGTAYSSSAEFEGTNAGGGVSAYDGGTILDSTISYNTVTGGTGAGSMNGSGSTGGNAVGAGVFAGGTLTITNSTVYGNAAVGGPGGFNATVGLTGGEGRGGGIAAANLTLFDSTVTGNTATGGLGGVNPAASPGFVPGANGFVSGGGIDDAAQSPMPEPQKLFNSIISGNTADGAFNDIGENIPGASGGVAQNNIIGVGGGLTANEFSNQLGINDPELSVFTDNGGPNFTLVPLPQSPAVNTGNPGLIPEGITTDQRGLPRIVSVTVDIGSTELQTPVETIFGTVTNDVNENGKLDVDEPGIGGVTVYIDTANVGALKAGDPVTTTDASGAYSFPGLSAGNYIVRQIIPTGFKQILPSGGLGEHLTVTAGKNNFNGTFLDQAAAMGSIFGTVFSDNNGNGKQDSGETGIGSVTVYIDTTNAGVLMPGDPTTTTGADGGYVFAGLAAGNYVVRQVVPSHDNQTFPTGGLANQVAVAAGKVTNNVNFGDEPFLIVGTGIIGAVLSPTSDPNMGIAGIGVYIDANNNGKLDSGELSTVTDSSGNYKFLGLTPGAYIVRQILPTGDQQISPGSGFGIHVILGIGQIATGQNFIDQVSGGGTSPGGSISGTVFNDVNGNGKLDAGELGIAGVTVYNDANNNGKLDAGEISTVTNASGVYTFSGLGAGAYLIRQILPAGDKQITPSQGFGNHVTLAANQVVSNANFGDQTTVVALASISGTVFNDANGNGKLDSGEGGISGWELYIDLNNSGKFVSGDPEVMTDAEGDFTFNGLAAGTYIVRVIAPSGWSQTTPANGFGQHITVASGQMIKGVLFGEKEIA